MIIARHMSAVCAALFAASTIATVIDDSGTHVQTTLDPDLRRIDALVPKRVDQIGTSRRMMGCETLDREYDDFDRYTDYLPALGIRRIRLQGGWARTEMDPSAYDFASLDRIIDARGRADWRSCSIPATVTRAIADKTDGDRKDIYESVNI